jgi:hypothetical protein
MRALVVVPVSRDRAMVVGPVRGGADLAMVADLCRLRLLGQRLGVDLGVRVLCPDLADLVEMAGLTELLVPDGPARDGAVLPPHLAFLGDLRAHHAVGTTVLIETPGYPEGGEQLRIQEVGPGGDAAVVDLEDVQGPG